MTLIIYTVGSYHSIFCAEISTIRPRQTKQGPAITSSNNTTSELLQTLVNVSRIQSFHLASHMFHIRHSYAVFLCSHFVSGSAFCSSHWMFIWMFSSAICTARLPGPTSCSWKNLWTCNRNVHLQYLSLHITFDNYHIMFWRSGFYQTLTAFDNYHIIFWRPGFYQSLQYLCVAQNFGTSTHCTKL
jgi:hypothetical protein